MGKEEISLGKQGYIETIYELCEKAGGAGTKAIAERLGVRMPSVTQALRRLSDLGLVNYSPRREVTLTGKGKSLATDLQRRHEILEDFFKRIGCAEGKAARIACLVEHDIDMDVALKIQRIAARIE